MSDMMSGIKVRKCGCATLPDGVQTLCGKHAAKEEVKQERGLRRAVAEQTEKLGHELSRFKEYESQRGKWTSFCVHCGGLVIVYDEIPDGPDQISGKILTEECRDSRLVAMMKGVGE